MPSFGGVTLKALRDARELRTAIGMATMRAGSWPASNLPGAPAGGAIAEVITLELDRRRRSSACTPRRSGTSSSRCAAARSWAAAACSRPGHHRDRGARRRHGRGLHARTRRGADLPRPRADRRIVARGARDRAPAVAHPRADAELAGFDAELAQARSRLLPGEALLADEFAEVADLLRLLVRACIRRAPSTSR
jgi:hypothetical protein